MLETRRVPTALLLIALLVAPTLGLAPAGAAEAAKRSDVVPVVRFNATHTLSLAGGIPLVSPTPEGLVAFEYALVRPEGMVRDASPYTHRLAFYDAAGLAADGGDPLGAGYASALHVTEGAPLGNGWLAARVPVAALAGARGSLVAFAGVVDAAGAASGAFLRVPGAVPAGAPGTPFVPVDPATGVPVPLANALAANPEAFAPRNPLANPGFDLATPGDALAPWTVVAPARVALAQGEGVDASNALAVTLTSSNAGGLRAARQTLAPEEGAAVLTWSGATALLVKARSDAATRVRAEVRTLDPGASAPTTTLTSWVQVPATGRWESLRLALPEPLDGTLLDVTLLTAASRDARLLLDDVAVEGAAPQAGAVRTDLADGFAVIITPLGQASGADGAQAVSRGVAGDYFLYTLTVFEYRDDGTPVGPAELAGSTERAFRLEFPDGTRTDGILLPLLGTTRSLAALVPAGAVRGDRALAWARIGIPDAEPPTFALPGGAGPAAGYHNALKYSQRGTPLADALDAAATPLRLDASRVDRAYAITQELAFVPHPEGGYGLRVLARSPFVEETTVTLYRNDVAIGAYPVVMDAAEGVLVPGLRVTEAELPDLIARSASTRFTTGATVSGGALQAVFGWCLRGYVACLTEGARTYEVVDFTSYSRLPRGENATYEWRFGDGTGVVRTTATTVAHAFTAPGTYVVNLTVVTESGKTASATAPITINNRAPLVDPITLTPREPLRTDNVVAKVRARDPEGGPLIYHWYVDGFRVASASGDTFTITPQVLGSVTDTAGLVPDRTYRISVVVTDGVGDTGLGRGNFTVRDLALQLGSPRVSVASDPNATRFLAGDDLLVRIDAQDVDDAVTTVEATLALAGPARTVALARVPGTAATWEAILPDVAAGSHSLTFTALNARGKTASATTPVRVRDDAPPTLALAAPERADAGDVAVFDASRTVDPDARGPLRFRWRLDNVSLPESTGVLRIDTAGLAGIHEVSLEVEDATGSVSSATRTLRVDDALHVDLWVDAPDFTSNATALARVTDDRGIPVQGADVTLRAYAPGGAAFADVTGKTDALGRFTWSVPMLLPGFNLPGEYRMEATAAALSREGATERDVELALTDVTYQVGILLP